MGEDHGTDQALENPKGTETKGAPENREEMIEEGGWPTNFREDKDDDLKEDEDAVDDCPEDSCRLVGDVAISVNKRLRQRRTLLQIMKVRTGCSHNSAGLYHLIAM